MTVLLIQHAGHDTVSQFVLLVQRFGFPTEAFLINHASAAVLHFLEQYRGIVATPLERIVFTRNQILLDLLENLLVFGLSI
jgi:hypothetical protein